MRSFQRRLLYQVMNEDLVQDFSLSTVEIAEASDRMCEKRRQDRALCRVEWRCSGRSQ